MDELPHSIHPVSPRDAVEMEDVFTGFFYQDGAIVIPLSPLATAADLLLAVELAPLGEPAWTLLRAEADAARMGGAVFEVPLPSPVVVELPGPPAASGPLAGALLDAAPESTASPAMPFGTVAVDVAADRVGVHVAGPAAALEPAGRGPSLAERLAESPRGENLAPGLLGPWETAGLDAALPSSADAQGPRYGSGGPAGGVDAASAVLHPPVRTLPAAALLVGAGLALPLWMLYRRVRQATALGNPHRKRVYELVLQVPGTTPSDLQRATGLHYATCVHHLRILEDLGFVELKRMGGMVRCFENHGRYGALPSRALAEARNPVVLAVLRTVLRQPGVSPADVARATGLSRPGVKHHLDRLLEEGLVAAQREGQRVRLQVPPNAIDAVVAALERPPAFSEFRENGLP
jgi:DNA-binding transcriptional ArsR family regulator